jgi:hypothetical protein
MAGERILLAMLCCSPRPSCRSKVGDPISTVLATRCVRWRTSRVSNLIPKLGKATNRCCAHAQLSPSSNDKPVRRINHRSLGKIWERTQNLKTPPKSHRISGPLIFVCSHNPKVVGSNPTAATKVPQTLQPAEFVSQWRFENVASLKTLLKS